jgi:hypothetical protein
MVYHINVKHIAEREEIEDFLAWKRKLDHERASYTSNTKKKLAIRALSYPV